MKTKAVRMYGKHDLRLEEFELPPIAEDEILAEIVSDSICMSTWKAAQQGSAHKRVPKDIDVNPIMVGHEFCGRILQVGAKWADQFHAGQGFAIQPAINYRGSLDSPGYSYPYIGGNATHIVIPREVMELDCLLPYAADAFFYGSLAEPMSCIIGTYHAMYHTTLGVYEHHMGIVEGGRMAIMAGAGPMGMGAIDYAVHGPRKPSLLVVTDINEERLRRAASIYRPEDAARYGITLQYVNTALEGSEEKLKTLAGGWGYDDVMVFAPVRSVVEMGDRLLGRDGCLNFFAGPADSGFSAMMNFYNVHYNAAHIVGTSGGNTDDLRESLAMISAGQINPSAMVTHVGGLNATADTTIRLPEIPGGKKLIYTQLNMELTAIDDFAEKGKADPRFAELAEIVASTNGLWNARAEQYLLAHMDRI